VCWGACPAGTYQCGALCLSEDGQCAGDILKMVYDVMDAAVSLAGADEDPVGAVTSVISVVKAFDYPICSWEIR